MLEICRYWTSDNQYIIIIYDETLEAIYIINHSLELVKIIDDIKNMNTDMLKIIVDDFENFVDVNKEEFYYSTDDVEWMREERCGLKVLEELKEEWDINPKEN